MSKAESMMRSFFMFALFKYEIHGKNKADECGEMVPVQMLSLENQVGNDAEHDEGDDLLYDLQLHQRERPAVVDEADTVGRHKETIFYACYHPREGDDAYQRPIRRDARLVELQVAVPRKRHEDIAANQQ